MRYWHTEWGCQQDYFTLGPLFKFSVFAPLVPGSAEVPAAVQLAATALGVNAILAASAHADSGNIFDFGLTMPIQMIQFLLLMIFLEKTVFTPVSALLNERAEQRISSARFKPGGGRVHSFFKPFFTPELGLPKLRARHALPTQKVGRGQGTRRCGNRWAGARWGPDSP